MTQLPQAVILVEHVQLREQSVDDSARTPSEVLQSASFRRLIATKVRVTAPLLGTSLAFILGVALLSGYGRGLMSTKIDGAFNVGYLLVACIYLVCWVVSVVYVRIANRVFEARANDVAAEARKGTAT